MKKQLYDFTIMSLVSIFAIDMAAEKAFARPKKEYDEIEAMIQKGEKTMKKASTIVKAAAKKQAEVEVAIVENVENLEETIVETQAAADSLSVAVETNQEELTAMKEVTTEITQRMAKDSAFAQKVLNLGFDLVVTTKTKSKVMDKRIEKASASGNDSLYWEILSVKRYYELNKATMGLDID